MAKLKIQDVPLHQNFVGNTDEFLIAIRDLQVGQSFLIDKIPSNFRIILAAMPILMGRKYVSRKDGLKFRVGRVFYSSKD